MGDSGLGGCICNVFVMLKPAWIDVLPSPQERCAGGNIFGLLASKILELALTSVEDAVNGFVVDPINSVIRAVVSWIPFIGSNAPQLPRACFTGYWKPGGRCFLGDNDMAAYFGCHGTDRAAAHKMCFWARQKSICMGSDGAYGRYKSLFTAPSGDELESRYRSIAGDSFNVIDPTFKAVFASIANSVQRDDVKEAQDICDSSVRARDMPTSMLMLLTRGCVPVYCGHRSMKVWISMI
jgi:hypothetical protein